VATTRPSIAVVGGGWAGCAAAVALARSGTHVTLFEQAKVLGGRARRVDVDGMTVDNGQHLLIGAYAQALRAIADVGSGGELPLLRLPFAIRPFRPAPDALALSAWRAPAPLHLAGALVSARGIGLAARWALAMSLGALAARGYRVADGETVAGHFAQLPSSAFEGVVAPLCVAALNTLPVDASAAVFARVLRATFEGPRSNSDFLLPQTDLGSLFPDAAVRAVLAAGGRCRTSQHVRVVNADRDGAIVDVDGRNEPFDAAIIAVGPHQLEATLSGAALALPACQRALQLTRAFRYEPITTVYLRFADRVALGAPIARLDDAPGQWVFERSFGTTAGDSGPAGSMWAVVISAHGPHDQLDHATLGAAVTAQLGRLRAGLPAVATTRVIAERRATYACTPGLLRPKAGRLGSALYLAGDYTDAEFPATLEAAVRSANVAATALLRDLGHETGAPLSGASPA
jgi:squalene-associated FAD-dependent desaturase